MLCLFLADKQKARPKGGTRQTGPAIDNAASCSSLLLPLEAAPLVYARMCVCVCASLIITTWNLLANCLIIYNYRQKSELELDLQTNYDGSYRSA